MARGQEAYYRRLHNSGLLSLCGPQRLCETRFPEESDVRITRQFPVIERMAETNLDRVVRLHQDKTSRAFVRKRQKKAIVNFNQDISRQIDLAHF